MDDAPSAAGRAHFFLADILRRAQGDAVSTFGLGPTEYPFCVMASGPYWRLRNYGDRDGSRSLLVIAAPIKRPYIWDLCPSVSAVGYCLRQGLSVYLLEWMPASDCAGNHGLDDCALVIADCIT